MSHASVAAEYQTSYNIVLCASLTLWPSTEYALCFQQQCRHHLYQAEINLEGAIRSNFTEATSGVP